jgi:hypothetical protein
MNKPCNLHYYLLEGYFGSFFLELLSNELYFLYMYSINILQYPYFLLHHHIFQNLKIHALCSSTIGPYWAKVINKKFLLLFKPSIHVQVWFHDNEFFNFTIDILYHEWEIFEGQYLIRAIKIANYFFNNCSTTSYKIL